MSKPAFIITNSGMVSIYMGGKAHVIGVEHPSYQAILTALKEENWEALPGLIDVSTAVKRALVARKVADKLELRDGQVFYSGEAIHNTVVDRIVEFTNKNLPFQPLVNFLERLLRNPSKASLDNLYRFLEVNQMPITEDGYFIAYKRVNDDYTDIRSGKFDNRPGNTVSMPRNRVQDDPNVTCSYGLHVAALGYARDNYASNTGRLVVVKVDPEHVVSVPTDYNNTKMRVCEYIVLADFQGQELTQEGIMPTAVAEEFDDDDDDFDDDDSWCDDNDDEEEDEDEYDEDVVY